MTLPSRRGRLRAAQEELAGPARDARARVMDLRLDDPVARVRPIDDRRREVERHLDWARPLVAHGELAGHHALVGDQGHDGARHLVEDRGDDAAVRQPGSAVEAVRDGAARDDALAEAPEAELEAVGIRGRAAEAAAVIGKGDLDVFRDRHVRKGYAPARPDEATPLPTRSSGRSPTSESSVTSAAATRSRPSAGSGIAITCMPAARAAS